MKRILISFSVFMVFCVGYSQENSAWKAVSQVNNSISEKRSNDHKFDDKLLYTLNLVSFKQALSSTSGKTNKGKEVKILFPNKNGDMEQFVVVESSNFAPELQMQYPEIRAYSGTGITDPTASINFSISPDGIQTMILRGDSASEFIEPLVADKSIYVLSTSKSRSKGSLPLTCKTIDVSLNKGLAKKAIQLKSNKGVFKTLRLALSCTGEYADYFGGTTAKVLVAMNNTITRVNGIFNRDLAVKLEIIANNNLLVFTNSATDPYSLPDEGKGTVANCTGDCPGTWNQELQKTITNIIGEANYDIGHLLAASGGGGDAYCIGCVCDALTSTNSTPVFKLGKGSGYTSPADSKPEGSLFDIDYVAHEIGHQIGANHIFSFDIEGSGVSVEPGSGSSIMGYAGITDYDVQKSSDDYFGYASILQIQDNLATKSCPVNTPLINKTPTVDAGADYTIPKNTPFILTGNGTDPNGDVLTYCWEQNDCATNQSNSDSKAYPEKPNGPLFRSIAPSISPIRYMPDFNRVLAGQLTTMWESVSSISRDLNFTLTVRDNAVLGMGQTNTDAMKVTVNSNSGPFEITSQNTENSSWLPGSSQLITWNVNKTNAIKGSGTVSIKLSTDGGLTFPIVLVSSTPNDGSELIKTPNNPAKNCRILIQPTSNIFYAVNSKSFSIGYTVVSTCDSYTYTAPFDIKESQTYTEKTIVVPQGISEIENVSFNIGITHSLVGDLQIELVSPKGTVVKLFNEGCGTSDSTLLLKFDDLGGEISCGKTILQMVAPYQLLSAFNGENPQGTWKLRVRDPYTGNTGKIDSASLTICSKLFTLSNPDHVAGNTGISPNPNKGIFDVEFTSLPENGPVRIVVYDLMGRKIFEKNYVNSLFFKETIDLANAAKGMYLVSVSDDVRDDVLKIVIQ